MIENEFKSGEAGPDEKIEEQSKSKRGKESEKGKQACLEGDLARKRV